MIFQFFLELYVLILELEKFYGNSCDMYLYMIVGTFVFAPDQPLSFPCDQGHLCYLAPPSSLNISSPPFYSFSHTTLPYSPHTLFFFSPTTFLLHLQPLLVFLNEFFALVSAPHTEEALVGGKI